MRCQPTNRPPVRGLRSATTTHTTASYPVSVMQDRATATSHRVPTSNMVEVDSLENMDPCHLGTPVCLPAVVWYEDTGGLLVVNLTWRGRNYIGTLADTSIQKPR